MKICVVGLGYVGVVSAACFAEMGHSVIGVDIQKKKVDMLNDGQSPIIEPGLQELVEKHVKSDNLKGVTDFDRYLNDIDSFIICVGTPSKSNGQVDLKALENVSKSLMQSLQFSNSAFNLIFRSTVPPGTMSGIADKYFNEMSNLRIAYHPEFLREGSALFDFYDNPQVVAANVKGFNTNELNLLFEELYKDIEYRYFPTEIKSSEAIKYINNSFHALKVAFANEIGRFCNAYDINTKEVIRIFLDDGKLNISAAYLRPGFAYGGSCLPKDLKALSYMARHADMNLPIIDSITRSNDIHIENAFRLITQSTFRKVGFNGITFKENTDDVRESPYVRLVEKLIGKGYDVKIFDKYINTNFLIGKNLEYLNNHIPHIAKRLVESEQDLKQDRDLIVVSHNLDKSKYDNIPVLNLSQSNSRENENILSII